MFSISWGTLEMFLAFAVNIRKTPGIISPTETMGVSNTKVPGSVGLTAGIGGAGVGAFAGSQPLTAERTGSKQIVRKRLSIKAKFSSTLKS
jgi:hypothetical protein